MSGGLKAARQCNILLTGLPAESFEKVWQAIEDFENRRLTEEYKVKTPGKLGACQGSFVL
jgi:hypothetical protein